MNSLMVWGLGFVFGAAVASGVWAIIWALSKGDRRIQRSRADAIQEIASESAEIENQLVAYSVKGMSETAFRSALSPRLEKITSLLSTNMHSFDVYYVKYIESLVARYRQALTGEAVPGVTKNGPETEPVELDKDTVLSLKDDAAEKIQNAGRSESGAGRLGGDDFNQGHFDQTWQMDFSKEMGERASFPSMTGVTPGKETVQTASGDVEGAAIPDSLPGGAPEKILGSPIQRKTEDLASETTISEGEIKDTKIIETEDISEEKQSEIERMIIAELSKEPQAQEKLKDAAKTKGAEPAVGGIQEFEIGKKTDKPEVVREFEVGKKAEKPDLVQEFEVGKRSVDSEAVREFEIGKKADKPEAVREFEVGKKAEKPDLVQEVEVSKKSVELESVREFDVSKKPLEPEAAQAFEIGGTAEPQGEKPNKSKKDEKQSVPQQKDEHFISGEDLVAKLDSFFGIKD
jgi:hypothetical protein